MAVCAPWETMKSSPDTPWSLKTRRIAALMRSVVSGSPSTLTSPFAGSAREDQVARRAHGSLGRLLGLRIPAISASFLTRRRSAKNLWSGLERDAVRAQVVCDENREANAARRPP